MEVDTNFVNDLSYYTIPPVLTETDKHSTTASASGTAPPVKCKRNASSCPSSPMITSPNSKTSDNKQHEQEFNRKQKSGRRSLYKWWKRKRRTSLSPNNARNEFNNEKTNSSDSNPNSLLINKSGQNFDDDPMESDDFGDKTSLKVYGGVSYIKMQQKLTDHLNVPLVQKDPSTYRVTQWQRKARWNRSYKKSDEESIDISIFYCDADGNNWAQYIKDNLKKITFTNSGDPIPSIQMLKLKTYSSTDFEFTVQENIFRTAKLQIVIISRSMLERLGSSPKMKVDRLFNPTKIIAIMINVATYDIYQNRTLVSIFYGFDDWIKINVKDRNSEFMSSLNEKVFQLLLQSEAYNGFSIAKNFTVCPHKVSKQSNQVYVHLKYPMKHKSDRLASLQYARPGEMEVTENVMLTFHNPYTLSFIVPEKFIKKISCKLQVYISIDNEELGWRELNCEGSLETLLTAFESVCGPIEFMIQALGIIKPEDSLDSELVSRLKTNLPLHLFNINDENSSETLQKSYLPSWLHFGAYYGLSELCNALLNAPGSKQISKCRNSQGETPAAVAYKAGFIELANILETFALENCSEKMNITLHLDKSKSISRQDSLTSTYQSSSDGSYVKQKSKGSFNLKESQDCFAYQNSEGSFTLQKTEVGTNVQNISGSFTLQNMESGSSLQNFGGCLSPRNLETTLDLNHTSSEFIYKNIENDNCDNSFGMYVDMKKNSSSSAWK